MWAIVSLYDRPLLFRYISFSLENHEVKFGVSNDIIKSMVSEDSNVISEDSNTVPEDDDVWLDE